MKEIKIYFSSLFTCISLFYISGYGQNVFPFFDQRSLEFPRFGDVFHPQIPALPPGVSVQSQMYDFVLRPNITASHIKYKPGMFESRDLQFAQFTFSDLSHSDLRGTNLFQAILIGSKLEGAKYNQKTQLPFSDETAQKLGMIYVQ